MKFVSSIFVLVIRLVSSLEEKKIERKKSQALTLGKHKGVFSTRTTRVASLPC